MTYAAAKALTLVKHLVRHECCRNWMENMGGKHLRKTSEIFHVV